jgi:serine/threonine-protein kinase
MIGTMLDGKYKMERQLGKGAMGAVYAARHKMINKLVAIKVLNPSGNDDPMLAVRFQQEAEAAARIRHPNIVAVNDFGEDDGQLYMVMDYVEGHSLRKLIAQELRLTPERTVTLGCQICAAVGVAHAAGIIHRDLKPENIMVEMVEGREMARVFDFGIAKLLDREGLTRAGYVLGTPYYMSPEQASAQPVDHRSDIYSIGVILYEMLTGIVPFSATKYQQVLVKHVIEPPRPLTSLCSDIPAGLADVVMQALEKNRDDRQQSTSELASQLRESLGSTAGQSL